MGNAVANDFAPLVLAGGVQLAAGTKVQYFSDTHAAWVDCVVTDIQPSGAVQLSCKRGYWMPPEEQVTKLRVLPLGGLSARHATAAGDDLELGVGTDSEYFSDTHLRWIPCRVLGVKLTGEVQLDVKPGYWMGADEQRVKLRRPLDSAPPLLASRSSCDAQQLALSQSAVAAHNLQLGGSVGQQAAPSGLLDSFQSLGTWTPKADLQGQPRCTRFVQQSVRQPSGDNASGIWGSASLFAAPEDNEPAAIQSAKMPATQILEPSFWGSLTGLFGKAGSGAEYSPRTEQLSSTARSLPLAVDQLDIHSHIGSSTIPLADGLNNLSSTASLGSGPSLDGQHSSLYASVASMNSIASIPSHPPVGVGRVGFDPGVEVLAFKEGCPAAKLQKHGRSFESSFGRAVEVPKTWSFASVSSISSSFSGVPVASTTTTSSSKLQPVSESEMLVAGPRVEKLCR